MVRFGSISSGTEVADPSLWGTGGSGGGPASLNSQTGTAYTLVLTDAEDVVRMSNAAANVLTVPLNSSVAFPIGTSIGVIRGGTGTTSIFAPTGVTINGLANATAGSLRVRYSAATLFKVDTNEWVLSGDLA